MSFESHFSAWWHYVPISKNSLYSRQKKFKKKGKNIHISLWQLILPDYNAENVRCFHSTLMDSIQPVAWGDIVNFNFILYWFYPNRVFDEQVKCWCDFEYDICFSGNKFSFTNKYQKSGTFVIKSFFYFLSNILYFYLFLYFFLNEQDQNWKWQYCSLLNDGTILSIYLHYTRL